MNLDLDLLKELARKSTRVVKWYAHGPGDQCPANQATVRGPCGRWFFITGGQGYEDRLADLHDEAKYADAAMNMLPFLIARIEQLEKQLQAFKMSEDL